MLFTSIAVLALGAALLAQRGPGEPRGGNPAARLKTALGLTDAQVTALNSLFEAEKSRVEATRAEIQQKRQELEAQLATAAPVAINVGNAAIALHNSELKLRAEQDSFAAQIKQQLTGEQQQKLDALLTAGAGRGLPGFGGPDGAGRGGRRGGPHG
jgi:Spy/CpxP family protein refolding chaperone